MYINYCECDSFISIQNSSFCCLKFSIYSLQGFHRYSVDEEWHVPHFEKMLYDQAQLLGVYADACNVCGDKYKRVVEDIAQYMDECLSHQVCAQKFELFSFYYKGLF